MMRPKQDCELGTEELERGLRPALALDFAKIATVAVSLLLVFNSTALLDWRDRPCAGTRAWSGWARRGFSSTCARSRGSFP
jgi:hypothetical protein